MNLSTDDIVDVIAQPYRVMGDPERRVRMVMPLDQAVEDSVSFCRDESDEEIRKAIEPSKAGIVICSNALNYTEQDYETKTLILVPNPKLAIIRVIEAFFSHSPTRYIASTAAISRGANIGENPIIYNHVTIYQNVRIGKRVIIHDGAVIGSDGFGFKRNGNGELVKFPQIGGVVIGDDVEIGANCTIDRAALGDTVIGDSTKLDNLVHIAHGVRIGKRCLLAACVMVAGGVKIGDDVWVGPSAAISSELTIGDGAYITLGSVVTKDVAPGQKVTGNFAIPHERFIAHLKWLTREYNKDV